MGNNGAGMLLELVKVAFFYSHSFSLSDGQIQLMCFGPVEYNTRATSPQCIIKVQQGFIDCGAQQRKLQLLVLLRGRRL